MNYAMDAAAKERLSHYIDGIGDVLGHPKRKEAFAFQTLGLFSDLERKSVEPIVALACPDPERVDAAHQSLLHFVSTSNWDDDAVHRFGARCDLDAMSARAPITTWIIDATDFLKQGNHSVGVKRQSAGSAGEVTTCQIGVSLTVSNGREPSQLAVTTLSAKMAKTDRATLQRALPDRADVRRDEGRMGAGPFRMQGDLGLAPSCIRRSLLLCLRRGRTCSVSFSLGRVRRSRLPAPTRGLSIMWPIRSSPSVAPSPAP